MTAYHVFCWSPAREALVEFDLADARGDGGGTRLLDELVEAGLYAVALQDGRDPPAGLSIAPLPRAA